MSDNTSIVAAITIIVIGIAAVIIGAYIYNGYKVSHHTPVTSGNFQVICTVKNK